MLSLPKLYILFRRGIFDRGYLTYTPAVAENPLEARLRLPAADWEKLRAYSRIKKRPPFQSEIPRMQLTRDVCCSEPVTVVDGHFIAVVPEERLDQILSDTGFAKTHFDDRKLFCTVYTSSPDHHGMDTNSDLDLFVSDSPQHPPAREPYAGNTEYRFSAPEEVTVKGYALLPCKVKKYNAHALSPSRAEARWNKRAALEKREGGSLEWLLGYHDSRREFTTLTGEDSGDLRVLDVGCGTLSNTWVAVVKKGLVLPEHMHCLDVSAETLLAGRCVYGQDLAKYGFDWKRQVSQGSALDLPYEDGQFDFIMAVNCLENVVNSTEGLKREKRNEQISRSQRNANATKFFKELARVLKDGGAAYISTFEHRLRDESDPYAFTAEELFSFGEDTPLRMPFHGLLGQKGCMDVNRYDYPHVDDNGLPTGELRHMISFAATKGL